MIILEENFKWHFLHLNSSYTVYWRNSASRLYDYYKHNPRSVLWFHWMNTVNGNTRQIFYHVVTMLLPYVKTKSC